MATSQPTPSRPGGERVRLPKLESSRIIAAGGPVTRALAVMQDADPDLARIRSLRRSIANRIQADIDLLDALAGDTDLEENGDLEPSLCGCSSLTFGEMLLPGVGGDDRELDAGDEAEQVNEDGGDIQDEPHDEDTDLEPDNEDKGAEEDEGPRSYYHRDRDIAPIAQAARQDLDRIARRRGKRLPSSGHGNVRVLGPCGSPYLVSGL